MLKPIGSTVVVRLEELPKETTGGILLVDNTKSAAPQIAEVLAVGPGITTVKGVLVPLDIESGDRVVIRNIQGVGEPVVVDGEILLVVDEDDILAKWEDDNGEHTYSL